ncbi:MAG: hypothetical protein JW874_01920 [Spirochaetales bacterium]|nr:hypothetical protein [Spirochaetales bacterium]
MKTAVIYHSRKGYVEEVAQKIGESLAGNAEIINMKKNRNPAISAFDAIVYAGSVIAGRFNSKIKKLILKNQSIAKGKKVYLVSAGLDDKGYMDILKNSFPEETLSAITEIVYAGGRYLPEQHNVLVRKLMAKINGAEGAVKREKPENIDKLIKVLS